MVAIGVAFLADLGIYVRIACIDGDVIERGRQRAEVIADQGFQPGMARFTPCGHGVVGLVGVVLIIKVNQEQPHFCRQRAIVISGSELPSSCFFRFHIAALHSLANLAVLYGAERAFGVCIKIPAVSEVIENV